jgi:hypothetical protein
VAIVLPNVSTGSVEALCTLLRHKVVVYTWRDGASQRAADQLLAIGPPNYSASGLGWSAVLGDRVPLAVQQAVVAMVAAALSGTSA